MRSDAARHDWVGLRGGTGARRRLRACRSAFTHGCGGADATHGADALAGALGWSLAKAVAAFALVFLIGRYLLRPLFHLVADRRSAEVFTLAVLLVALLAAWTTSSLGLSLAFGGFLAGMMPGKTEFRHQVESSIRPFRDVLLGLFFVGVGMRFDPAAVPPIWHWALLGALLMVVTKTLIVAASLRATRIDAAVAWRTGLLLAVGGEFGFALIAIALDANVIDTRLGQIALTSVLFSMIAGALLIRFNRAIALRLVKGGRDAPPSLPDIGTEAALRHRCPQVPIVARARDLQTSAQLLDAGATHAYPEAIEASLRLGATALRILRVPVDDIDLVVQDLRDWGYQPVLDHEPKPVRGRRRVRPPADEGS